MNTSPSGVAQCAAIVGELPITAITTSSSPALFHRAPEPRQRVHPAGAGVDEPIVVVLPTRLVLLRPAVVVDGVQHRAAGSRRRAEVDRRLPAVRADLEQRPERGGREPGLVEGEAFVVGHEADRVPAPRAVPRPPVSALGARAGPLGHGHCGAGYLRRGVRLRHRLPRPGTLSHPLGGGTLSAAPQSPDRNLAMDLARVTEAAALAAGRWMGRGDKNGADGAAVDAMRLVLNSVSMDGVVVIGEGEKDEAPMLFNGEEIGDGGPACDIAVDPIDGTTLTSLGRDNAISVIALSERGTMFDPGPCVYMDKIAVGPAAADVIDLDAPIRTNLEAVAKALGEDVDDITAVVLDRDRHADIIRECREAGARIRLIPDGDVAGAIAVAWPESGSDILFGIGGTPEGVIAACALKCLGGAIFGRMWPRNDDERTRRARCRLRPRPRAQHRRSRVGRRRVLRGHRHHERRSAEGRPLLG